MDDHVRQAIVEAVEREPFALTMGLKLLELNHGQSLVEMVYKPESMNNIYGRAHGGAMFALIDEAFETASQTDGTVAVALNVNVTYVSSPEPGTLLRARAECVARTRRTATYDIKVTDSDGNSVALCQALAFQTGKPIPFLKRSGA
jgi:acyl-CoA thioesterase